tara:strand:+ start:178 stop:429 length:252 start_codon:yes stop_codon:yes gene_type:complete
MDTIDSEAEVSGKSWIRIMFIFSVMLILIGLILDDTMASSDTLGPTGRQLFGLLILFTGGLMFLITGFIISLRVLKSLLMKNS